MASTHLQHIRRRACSERIVCRRGRGSRANALAGALAAGERSACVVARGISGNAPRHVPSVPGDGVLKVRDPTSPVRLPWIMSPRVSCASPKRSQSPNMPAGPCHIARTPSAGATTPRARPFLFARRCSSTPAPLLPAARSRRSHMKDMPLVKTGPSVLAIAHGQRVFRQVQARQSICRSPTTSGTAMHTNVLIRKAVHTPHTLSVQRSPPRGSRACAWASNARSPARSAPGGYTNAHSCDMPSPILGTVATDLLLAPTSSHAPRSLHLRRDAAGPPCSRHPAGIPARTSWSVCVRRRSNENPKCQASREIMLHRPSPLAGISITTAASKHSNVLTRPTFH